MPTDTGFSRPTLQTLINRVEADINTTIPGADSRVRRNAYAVFARTIAGMAHGLYGYLDWIAKQVIIDTATDENIERWASIWGLSRNPATKATGDVVFTGTNGSAINIGTRLIRSDDAEYVTTTAGVISGGTLTLAIEAVIPGADGNTGSGTLLNMVSPISGVDATTTTGEIANGADTEADAYLRARLLERIQAPPHGGADFDYIAWAKAITGVTRVWVYPNELGAGTVTVRFMMDDTYTNGIPLSGDVTEVQTYIDTVRPVTADVTVVAPIANPVAFNIALKKSDGTSETSPTVRAAVIAELTDMIRRDATPGGTLYRSRLIEAISVAAGEYSHVLTTPAGNVTNTTGYISTVGAFTWS